MKINDRAHSVLSFLLFGSENLYECIAFALSVRLLTALERSEIAFSWLLIRISCSCLRSSLLRLLHNYQMLLSVCAPTPNLINNNIGGGN